MIEKISVLIVCGLIAFVGKPGIAAGYRVVQLPLLTAGEHDYCRGSAINDVGQVVGCASYAQGKEHDVVWGKEHAVVWGPEGAIKDLGCLPGGDRSSAYDINNQGQIVGWSNAGPTETLRVSHAVLWDKEGCVKMLGIAEDESSVYKSSQACAINNRGQVVGRRGQRAFLWSAEMGMVDLAVLAGGRASHAEAINDSGQIVGWHDNAEGKQCPVMWDSNGSLRDLTPVLGDGDIALSGINKSGVIVGSRFKDKKKVAFLWSPSEGLREFGTLPDLLASEGFIDHEPTPGSEAASVNDLGQVVGSYRGKGTVLWGFYWSSSEGILSIGAPPRTEQPKTEDKGGDAAKGHSNTSRGVLDKPTQLSVWSYPCDINNKGVIAGSTNGRAAVWTPE